MTKTFEQAIAEFEKEIDDRLQAIAEAFRKYPDGFRFTHFTGYEVEICGIRLHSRGIKYDSASKKRSNKVKVYSIDEPSVFYLVKPLGSEVVLGAFEEDVDFAIGK